MQMIWTKINSYIYIYIVISVINAHEFAQQERPIWVGYNVKLSIEETGYEYEFGFLCY
jgi:hypothetical protein